MLINVENNITGAHPHLVLRQSAGLVPGDAFCFRQHISLVTLTVVDSHYLQQFFSG